MDVTLRQADGSVSATIPAELARRFQLAPGDHVQVTATEHGILLSPYEPTVQESLALAAEAARQFEPALRELAR